MIDRDTRRRVQTFRLHDEKTRNQFLYLRSIIVHWPIEVNILVCRLLQWIGRTDSLGAYGMRNIGEMRGVPLPNRRMSEAHSSRSWFVLEIGLIFGLSSLEYRKELLLEVREQSSQEVTLRTVESLLPLT